MDKSRILLESKNEMVKIIDRLNFLNLEEAKGSIDQYFAFIEKLSLLPLPESSESLSTINVSSVEKESPAPVNNEVFILDRKLKGAYLKDTNIKVSESVIRKERFKHGDKISYVREDGKYLFKLVEKGDQVDPPLRRQIDFAEIEIDGPFLVIRKERKTNTDIKINGVPFSFRVSDKDRLELNLQEGDLVDIAYYENKPESTSRVIWKHHNRQDLTHSIPLASTNSQDTNKEPFIPLLEGLTILVVGGESKKPDIQKRIEEHKGLFDWLNVNETRDSIKKKVTKADLVLYLNSYLRNLQEYNIRAICSQYHVPFREIPEQDSIEKIVEEAVKLKIECGLSKINSFNFKSNPQSW